MTGPFDDGSIEPRSLDLPDDLVYCASCGTVFVFGKARPCPTCEVAEAVEDLDGELDELAEHHREVLDEILDGGLFGGLLTGGGE
mgnify:CR=1 FL=1